MNFKISIAILCVLCFSLQSMAQKITFSYANGHTISEQITGGASDVEIASSADCETEEISIVLSNADSAHWKDGYKGVTRQLTVTSGGFYDFGYYHSDGCIDSAAVWIDPVVPANTSIEGPDEVSEYGSQYEYTALGEEKSSYTWSFVGDSIASTAGQNAYIFWQRHIDTFKVRVTEKSMYGCNGPKVSLSVLNKFVSTNTLRKLPYSIYPNPVAHTLQIEGLNTEAQYSIFTVSGTQVLHGVFQNSIAIGNLPQGQYVIEIKTASERSRHLFTKL